MAEAIANAVISGNHKNRTYEITSSGSWSFYDIAQMISDVSGSKTDYLPLSRREYRQSLLKSGLPENAVAMSMVIADSIAAGEFDYTDKALEKLIGRQPLDVKNYIADLFKRKN